MQNKFRNFVRLAIVVLVASAFAAAPAETVLPDVHTMTLPQLLAEFRGPPDYHIPQSQRSVDIINSLRRAGQPLLDAMRTELTNGDAKVRYRAMVVLRVLGNKARPLTPDIIVSAGDADSDVRACAISALCHLRDPRAFELLVKAAHDPAAYVRISVIRDGQKALADAPFALAVNALKDPDPNLRVVAIGQLRLLNDKRAAAYIAPVLQDVEVHGYHIDDGIKSADRNSDKAALALEYLVNGVAILDYGRTQEQKDDLLQKWQTWWKEKGEKFDAALYDEPELERALE